MKIVVFGGIVLVAWYVDASFYNGVYWRALGVAAQRIAHSFGVPL